MINNKSIVPYRTGLPISRSFLNVRLQYSAALYIHEDQLNYNTRFLMDIKIFLHRFRQMISNACNYKLRLNLNVFAMILLSNSNQIFYLPWYSFFTKIFHDF